MNECTYESLEALSSLFFPSSSFGALTLSVGAGLRSGLVHTRLPHPRSPGLLAVTQVSLLLLVTSLIARWNEPFSAAAYLVFNSKLSFFSFLCRFKRQLDSKREKQDVIIAFSFSKR